MKPRSPAGSRVHVLSCAGALVFAFTLALASAGALVGASAGPLALAIFFFVIGPSVGLAVGHRGAVDLLAPGTWRPFEPAFGMAAFARKRPALFFAPFLSCRSRVI